MQWRSRILGFGSAALILAGLPLLTDEPAARSAALPAPVVEAPIAAPESPAREAPAREAPAPAMPAVPAPTPTPAPPTPPPPTPPPVPEPEAPAAPVLSALPLTVSATNVARDARFSTAVIVDPHYGALVYGMNDALPGGGPIVAISPRYVDFVARSGRLERLDLMKDQAPPPPRPAQPARGPAPSAAADPMAAELDAAIKKKDDTHYTIDARFRDKMLADPTALLTTLRGRPVAAAGKLPGGLKISSIRPGSPAQKLGLMNGDIIVNINGHDLGNSSPDKLLEMYSKLKGANNLGIQVHRGGKTITIEYLVQ